MTQTIEIPEGFELKKVSDTEYRIIKKEKILPKTWEEFCELNPIKRGEYFIETRSDVVIANPKNRLSYDDRNILPSKEKAQAILAFCQLIQLRDCYNNGWKPDWSNPCQEKYAICYNYGHFNKDIMHNAARVLAFKSEKFRDEFFYNFKDLIEKLKPLYE